MLYTPPECGTTCQSQGILAAVNDKVQKYNVPRWFLYAIIAKETSWNACSCNANDYGKGVSQITGNDHQGYPYPENLSSPDNSNSQWRSDMGLAQFGSWINMSDVTSLATPPATNCSNACGNGTSAGDAYDPQANLDRFLSGYAAPAYYSSFVNKQDCSVYTGQTRADCEAENLQRVAFYWNHGIFDTSYPNYPDSYLDGTYGYKYWVNQYRSNVEQDDGLWLGSPCTPPYSSSGCGAASTDPTYTSSATPTPSCRVADGGTISIANSFTNTNNVSYTGILDSEVWDGTTKVGQGYLANQTIGANGSGSFSWSWTVPTSLPTGTASKTYALKVGVFDSSWGSNPYWNDSAGTVTISADNAQYNFECNSAQGWSFNSGGLVNSVSPSTTRAYAGTSSLAVSLSGNSSPWGVWSNASPLPGAGATVVYHVWIPSGSNISSVQAFVKQGAAGGWTWTGSTVAIADLTPDAWNAISVTVPSNAVTPLDSMGVEFSVASSWTGTVYVDSVTW